VGVVLVFVASLLIFAATNVLPGDAANAILGQHSTPEALAELRAELGLDRPLYEQYLDWIGNLLSGDLGRSVTNKQPVSDLIGYRVVNTLALALTTIVFLVPLALALGTFSGVRAGRRADQGLSWLTLAIIALPEFVIGSILVLVLSVALDLFPPISLVRPGENPLAEPSHLVLPVLTLLLVAAAWMVRYIRAGVAEANLSEYAAMARLNGLPESRVVWKHVLPNALVPSIQAFALTLQWLLGGVLIVETMFSYPGIGEGLVQAISVRDPELVQSTAVLIAVVYIAITIVADLLVVLLVPKLRTST
jgi:peptide/nickel transport system permease protein